MERITGRLSDQPLLFQYTIKLVLLVAFLELILYRLVSRLGMHLSKLAVDHQWIIPTFTALTEVGPQGLKGRDLGGARRHGQPAGESRIHGSDPVRRSLYRLAPLVDDRVFVRASDDAGVGHL